MRLNQEAETLRSVEKRQQSQIQKEETQIPKTRIQHLGKVPKYCLPFQRFMLKKIYYNVHKTLYMNFRFGVFSNIQLKLNQSARSIKRS